MARQTPQRLNASAVGETMLDLLQAMFTGPILLFIVVVVAAGIVMWRVRKLD
jgi:type IV secretory pathway VirB2 component (pilin)